jgi:CheY-like chemotaxis protein
MKSSKILIVDDLPANRFLIREILSMLGYGNTVEANDGKMAIEKIKKEKFDLVFMDISMPELNGDDATMIIRNELKKDMPIIAITAFEHYFKSIDVARVGFNEIFTKPYSQDKIDAVVKKYLS